MLIMTLEQAVRLLNCVHSIVCCCHKNLHVHSYLLPSLFYIVVPQLLDQQLENWAVFYHTGLMLLVHLCSTAVKWCLKAPFRWQDPRTWSRKSRLTWSWLGVLVCWTSSHKEGLLMLSSLCSRTLRCQLNNTAQGPEHVGESFLRSGDECCPVLCILRTPWMNTPDWRIWRR